MTDVRVDPFAPKGAKKSPALGAALIILLTFVAYIPAMRGGFVFDDYVLITENRMIKASDGLRRFWFTTEAPDYYPLTSSLWWLEWRLWGDSAAAYHTVNVLLHAINAALVWMVLRRLRIRGSWLAALVFAMHPVNAATAAWISEQKNTLSMFFYAVAILLFLRFDQEGRWRWYGLSLVAFLLGLLSKAAVVMLPIVLLGCVWWLHGRVQRKDLLRSGPFIALSLVLGVVTMWFQHNRALALGGLSAQTGNILSQVATAGCALWFYLYKAILPWNLCAIYPRWNVDASHWISYVPGLVLVGCFTLFWWRRNTWGRPLLFGLGYFVVMLFPVLGFFHISFHEYSWVADPWQYPAIAGVIALVVAATAAMCHRMGQRGQSAGMLASVAVVTLLGVATWRRGSIYGVSESLWQDTVVRNPNAWVAHYNLGNAYLQANRTQDAVGEYQEAMRLRPDSMEVHNNLAFALLRAGQINDAIAQLEQVVRISPDSAEGHYNLGNACLQAGRVQDSIVHLERAVQLKPDYAEARCMLGNALLQGGKPQDAIVHYEETVRLNPDYTEAHVNLGFALAQRGKFDEAVRHWETALRLDPGNQNAQRGLERVRSIRSSSAPTP